MFILVRLLVPFRDVSHDNAGTHGIGFALSCQLGYSNRRQFDDLACGAGRGELLGYLYCLPGLGCVNSFALAPAGCPSGSLPNCQLGPLQSWVDMELVICTCLYILGCVVGFWLIFYLLYCFHQATCSALRGLELI